MTNADTAALVKQISALEAQAKHGIDHPWAGVCGEDDARADRLAELRNELMGTLTPTQNSNARRIKNLVDGSSVASVAYALHISQPAVRLAVAIANELADAEAMWELHTERSNV